MLFFPPGIKFLFSSHSYFYFSTLYLERVFDYLAVSSQISGSLYRAQPCFKFKYWTGLMQGGKRSIKLFTYFAVLTNRMRYFSQTVEAYLVLEEILLFIEAIRNSIS